MKSFFSFFLNNSKLAFVLTLALFVMGFMGFKSLRRETRPAVDFARVLITTIFPGSSPDETEELITLKIEEQIRTVDGIKDSRSVSAPGVSSISLWIDIDNEETIEVVDEIQRSLSRVKNLPTAILDPPYLLHIKAKEIPLLRVVLTGGNTHRERDQLAFQLKTAIEKDKGAAGVQFVGYKEREFKVILDPEKLKTFHISSDEAVRAVSSSMKDISAGVLRSSSLAEQVQFMSKRKTVSDIENIVVRSNFSGNKIFIKDIAKVQDHQQETTELVRFNGKPATYLLVTKKEKADSITLSNRLEKLIKNYPVPEGYTIQIYDNEAERTKNQLSIVINNAWLGLALVLIVLLILLPGRLGFLSALSLPISILGTIALCSSFGITFNSITMLAFIICIGMLVDNAVVISENYARLRIDGIAPTEAALNSVLQLYRPITATVLTTVSAFLPMLVTKGVMGQFIMWIPIVVSVALMTSLFDAFLLLPSRLKWTIRSASVKTTKIQQLFHRLMENFENLVLVCIRKRYLVFFSIVGIIIFSFSVNFWGNKFILFPKNDVRHYYIYFEAPEGSSTEETDRLSEKLIDSIYSVAGEEIEGLLTQSGGQGLKFFRAKGSGESTGEMFLLLKEDSFYRRRPEILLEKLRNIEHSYLETLQFEPRGGGPPVGEAVHVVLSSNDRRQLEDFSHDLKKQISTIHGVVEIEDDQVSTGPEYHIKPRLTQLAALGMTPVSLGQTLQTALTGRLAGELTDQGEIFDVRIYYEDHVRADMEQLKQIKIQSPSGSLIPLEKVAEIKKLPKGSSFRKRFDFQPAIEVKARIDEKKTNSEEAVKQTTSMIQKLSQKYPGTSYIFLGEKRSTQESMQSLYQAMILAVFGIFIILLILFRGFMISFLALSTISLGLIGVSLAFALHQKPLSFLTLIGVVGLSGVTINAAIILINFIEEMRKQKPETPLHQVLSQSTRFRFKPIVITTCTTVLGLFPAAYSIGGSDQILIPMTLAFTWGLMTASFFTLFWVPCGYAIIEDINNWFLKKIRSFKSPKLP